MPTDPHEESNFVFWTLALAGMIIASWLIISHFTSSQNQNNNSAANAEAAANAAAAAVAKSAKSVPVKDPYAGNPDDFSSAELSKELGEDPGALGYPSDPFAESDQLEKNMKTGDYIGDYTGSPEYDNESLDDGMPEENEIEKFDEQDYPSMAINASSPEYDEYTPEYN